MVWQGQRGWPEVWTLPADRRGSPSGGALAGRMTVSERDLRTMLRLVSDPGDDHRTEPMSCELLHELKELIACDSIVVTQLDTMRCEILFMQSFPADDGSTRSQDIELEQLFWKHYRTSAACCYPDVSGDGSGTWRTVAPMPTARANAAVAVLGETCAAPELVACTVSRGFVGRAMLY
jgi:hypothetical protein